MSVLVQVFGVLTDENTKTSVVVLRAVEGEETLPIQIGLPEASAIFVALHGVVLPRPMTHDLAADLIEKLGGKLEKVEVVDLREGTFYGLLHVRKGQQTIRIDCRPSDAIALALRTKAPIFVADEVFKKVQPADIAEASKQHWMGFISDLEMTKDQKDFD